MNTLFITHKIDQQLNLNIKTSGINLWAVEKMFQVVLATEILKNKRESLVTTITTTNYMLHL